MDQVQGGLSSDSRAGRGAGRIFTIAGWVHSTVNKVKEFGSESGGGKLLKDFK